MAFVNWIQRQCPGRAGTGCWMRLISRTIATTAARRGAAEKILDHTGAIALYHHQPNGEVSPLDLPPLVLGSPTVLGSLSSKGQFTENPSFIDLVHSVFSASYLDDPHVRELALVRKSDSVDSYVHVLGNRTKTPTVNDRDPTSIIFSFLVQSSTGMPVPNTYEPNPVLRIYTPLDGFLVFPNSLQQALIRGCKIARSIEENDG